VAGRSPDAKRSRPAAAIRSAISRSLKMCGAPPPSPGGLRAPRFSRGTAGGLRPATPRAHDTRVIWVRSSCPPA